MVHKTWLLQRRSYRCRHSPATKHYPCYQLKDRSCSSTLPPSKVHAQPTIITNLPSTTDTVLLPASQKLLISCSLWPPYIIGQAIIFLPCGFFLSIFYLSFFLNLSGHRLDVYHTSTHGVALVWIKKCRSEICCSRLAANAGPKKVAKNRYMGTIAQLCRAISSQLRHVSTIGKKFVKQQYLLHMSSQYGELRPTSGWDRFVSLGHPR